MKGILLLVALVFTSSAYAEGKNIWGHKNSQKEPLFDKVVHNYSKEYKKEQERRERADFISVTKNRIMREQTIKNYQGSPPLADFEIHYFDMVRANKIRECRLEGNLTNFDILVRHRWDRNFGGSAFGYKVLNGNAW